MCHQVSSDTACSPSVWMLSSCVSTLGNCIKWTPFLRNLHSNLTNHINFYHFSKCMSHMCALSHQEGPALCDPTEVRSLSQHSSWTQAAGWCLQRWSRNLGSRCSLAGSFHCEAESGLGSAIELKPRMSHTVLSTQDLWWTHHVWRVLTVN